MPGDITTQLHQSSGRLRITVTEMLDDGLNQIVVTMPTMQAKQFASTISNAIDEWERKQ